MATRRIRHSQVLTAAAAFAALSFGSVPLVMAQPPNQPSPRPQAPASPQPTPSQPQPQQPSPDRAAAQIDPAARELLDQVRQQLANAQSFTTQISHSFNMNGPSVKQEMTSKYDMAVQRPNKIALELKQGAMGETIISDGQTLYTYWPSLNAYTKTPAPSSIEELFKQDRAETAFGSGPLATVGPLLLQKDLPEAFATVRELRMLDPQEEDGHQVRRIAMVVMPNRANMPPEVQEKVADKDLTIPIEFWISADQPQVQRIILNLTPMISAIMDEMNQAGEDQAPDAAAMRDMQYEMVTAFRNWRFDADIPADRFTFNPPEGARQVASMLEAMQQSTNEASPADALVGKPAPAFELTSLDGNTVSLAQHKGNDIVILDFWATWCGPCVKALPEIMEVARDYKDRNVVLYAVDLREDNDKVRQFINQKQWNDLRVLMDQDGAIAKKYNVRGIPQTVIIDKDGTVQAVHIGYSPDNKQRLHQEIDALLGGKKVATQTGEADD